MLAGAAILGLAVLGQPAAAQNAVFDSGDTVVTGFSGIKPQEGAPPPAGNPLDGFFIDTEGASMKVFKVGTPAQPQAQMLNAPAGFTVPASKVGQVFAITLDESADGVTPPNIYLGATSVFGLNILAPEGGGQLKRSSKGAPGAVWMDGQFGPASDGGTPGSIYKVDSVTGQVSLFVTLPGNTGPGLGDIVFDKATRQFFASDLDTGLIHRIDASGTILDSFDHGTMGRPGAGLAPIADDGSAIDITSPAFDTNNPATWAFTPRERMVWGMNVHAGRLYYAVQGSPEIWSVGINIDGTFASDARLEFKVDGLAGDTYISDMLFDAKGQLYLAQRGEFRGSYDYSVFAEPQRSDVLRYRQEMPDDPATPGTWVPVPESYAIGFPEGHKNASGGIAIGTCDARTLWTTGDNLRNNPAYEAQLAAGGPLEVHGLQGNSTDLVRPQNEPPFQSVFVDYDGQFGDPEKAGHVGDVEIWQSCKGQGADYGSGYYIPPYGELPPDYVPPSADSFNLELRKFASPHDCWRSGNRWICRFTVRVRNTGPTAYLGPVSVHDHFPALPAGSNVTFAFQPPWNCAALGADDYRCDHPPVYLVPGASIDLYVRVNMPVVPNLCHLPNVATIEWPGGWGDSNPADDSDWANARVPGPDCGPHGDRTDLKIEKIRFPGCTRSGGTFLCGYLIKVTNAGLGDYNGQIRITDTVPAGTTATFFGGPMWNACPGGPATYTCTRNPQLLTPGQSVFLFVRVNVPLAVARDLHCRVKNETHIVLAPGGSAQNTNPANDDASAIANIPQEICDQTPPDRTNLRLEKRVDQKGCIHEGDASHCYYNIRVTNTGPGAYNGVVVVHDVMTAGTTATFSPGWTCPGGGPAYNCWRAVNLPNPGNFTTLGVRVTIPDGQAREMGCRVRNQARITWAPGGSPRNTNPGDDSDAATAAIPDEVCHRQQTNLRVMKRGSVCERGGNGWECSYTITVQNMGPGVYNDTIELAEMLPAEPVSASWNAPWSCVGAGGGGGGSATCTHPVTMIPALGTRVLNLRVTFSNDVVRQHNCNLLNRVRISHAPGGTPANTNPGDDNASATATVPGTFCVHTVPITEPPVQKCPPGYFWTGNLCERPICPRGEYMSRGHCCPYGKVWNGERCGKPQTPDCPPGTHGKYPRCIPDETPHCPPNWTGKPPVCCPPDRPYYHGQCGKPQDDCRPGEYKSHGHCCPNGTEWNNRRDKCIGRGGNDDGGKQCPNGTHGRYPLCVPDSLCKPGEHLSQGHCCSKGTEWNGRRARCIGGGNTGGDDGDKKCPKGTHGKYPLCLPDVRDCPKGTHGKYPRCAPDEVKQCPKGTIGKYPNCRSVGQICSGGKVLKRGNCVSLPDKPQIKDILKLQKDRVKRLQPERRPDIKRQFGPQFNQAPKGGMQIR